jgi:hypothetical protein
MGLARKFEPALKSQVCERFLLLARQFHSAHPQELRKNSNVVFEHVEENLLDKGLQIRANFVHFVLENRFAGGGHPCPKW